MIQETYFGNWLVAFRKQRNLTQASLAEAVDRSVDAISNIERGKSLPSYEMLATLCQKLDVEPSAMFETGSKAYPKHKRELLARLNAVSNELSENELRIAVEQVEVLSKNSR